jgi:cytochrome c oxidase assembly factor CtaG
MSHPGPGDVRVPADAPEHVPRGDDHERVGRVLYAHYATNVRSWGPSALVDQQTAGGLMWLGGDLLFLTAIFLIIAGWMAHEKRQEAVVDRRARRRAGGDPGPRGEARRAARGGAGGAT